MNTRTRPYRSAVLMVIVIAAAMSVIGAGCWKKKTAAPAAPSAGSQGDVSSLELKQGSAFIIQQTGLAFEGKFDIVEPAHNVRKITLTSYQPNVSLDVGWDLTQLVLTDEARAALKAYEDGGKQGEAPKPTYGQMMGGGTLTVIDLKSTHELTLPAGWDVGDHVAPSGGVFVSDDVYRELSRTRNSTIYLQALDAARTAVGVDANMNKLISAISDRVDSLDGKIDVDLMKAEEGRVDYQVKINGAETTVKAIKARNWYGEILVLDNPQNPLILQFAFDPDLKDIKASENDVKVLKGLLSYNVAEINP